MNVMIWHRRVAVAFGGILLLAAMPAEAVPITYTESATVTGTLNGVLFTGTLTLTGSGDTAKATGGPNFRLNRLSQASFTIKGGASGTITDDMEVFRANYPGGLIDQAAFASLGPGPLFAVDNVAFGPYDLTTSIGPITGDFDGVNIATYNTTVGILAVTGNNGFATFGATTDTPTSVPEPSTLGLLGGAAIAFGLTRRRVRTYSLRQS